MDMRIVIGISGASGSAYATRLVEELYQQCEVVLVVSETAKQIMADETEFKYNELAELAHESFDNHDMGASICSGSSDFHAMVIVPCSMTTMAKLACGIGDNVITRAGSVALKERRKLIMVPRETPMSSIQIENMLKLSREDAIMLPAMPGFYGCPETALELVNFVVGRILDQLGIENDVGVRWTSE